MLNSMRMIILFVLIFGAFSSVLSEEKHSFLPSGAVKVLDYRMEEGDGRILLDSSGFNNHASAIALPYEDVFKWIPRKTGGTSLKIGNSPLSKGARRGAFIANSASLRPEEFKIDFEIKPCQKHESVTFANILVAQTTPFYYKKPKTKDTKVYTPLVVRLLKDYRIQVIISMIGPQGKISNKVLTSNKIPPTGEFTRISLVFNGGEFKIYFDHKLDRKWKLSGKILYEHPDYYPGHVAYKFGSGVFNGELDNFQIYDLNMGDKTAKYDIKISTDKYLNFFAPEEDKEFTVGVTNFADTEKSGTLSWRAEDHDGKTISSGKEELVLESRQDNLVTVEIPSEKRGCFWLKCIYQGENGQIVEREEQYAVGAIRDVSDYPANSPFGIDASEIAGNRSRTPDLGMKWARLWLNWSYIEPEKGDWIWDVADGAVAFHHGKGRKIMGCLYGTPFWAVTDKVKKMVKNGELSKISTMRYPAADLKYRKEFVEKVVKRYRDQVDVWEVWNEANTGYWQGTPEEFMAMLKQTHEIVRRLDPTAKIAGPSNCHGGWDAWSGEILEMGAGEYLDIFVVHYLGGGYPGFRPEHSIDEIKGAKDMLKSHDADMPLWDGESGYFSATRDGATNRPYTPDKLKEKQENKELCLSAQRSGSPYCVDEFKTSAAYVRKIVLCLSKNIGRCFRHNVGLMKYEADIGNNGRYAKGTGVLFPAIAWANMSEWLGDAKYLRAIDLDNEKLYGFLFKNRRTDRNFAVFWSSEGEQDIDLVKARPDADTLMEILTLGMAGSSSKLKKYDIWGNPAVLKAQRGNRQPLTLGETPFYLDGLSEKVELAEAILGIEAPSFVSSATPATIKLSVGNPFPTALEGIVKIQYPNSIKFEPKEIAVKLLPSQKTVKALEVLVTPDFKGQKFQTIFSLNSPSGIEERKSVTLQVTRPPFKIQRKKAEIAVDGKVDEEGWRDIPPMILSDEEQVVIGRPLCYADRSCIKKDKEWYGPDDLSAESRVCIDNENLYLQVKVKDNSICINDRNKRPFLSDGIEVFIDGRPKKEQAKEGHSAGVCQIILTPGDKKHPKASWIGVGKAAADHCPWAIVVNSRKTKYGYILEAKIPLDKQHFPKLDLKNGGIMGFDICVNDADHQNPRKSQISWRGTKDNYRNAARFGKLAIPAEKTAK